jgi:hypothetical protein
MIALVTGSEIRKNRDGARNVLMLQVQCGDSDDVQSVEMMCAMGEDFRPPVGTKVILTEIGAAYKVAVAGDDGIVPTTAEGERKIYSITAGAQAAVTYYRADGVVEHNGGGGTSVEFGRLQTAFNQLQSDFDDFVAQIYNLHNHPTAPVGPVSTPSVLGLASTADISAAESDTVEIP